MPTAVLTACHDCVHVNLQGCEHSWLFKLGCILKHLSFSVAERMLLSSYNCFKMSCRILCMILHPLLASIGLLSEYCREVLLLQRGQGCTVTMLSRYGRPRWNCCCCHWAVMLYGWLCWCVVHAQRLLRSSVTSSNCWLCRRVAYLSCRGVLRWCTAKQCTVYHYIPCVQHIGCNTAAATTQRWPNWTCLCQCAALLHLNVPAVAWAEAAISTTFTLRAVPASTSFHHSAAFVNHVVWYGWLETC